MARPLQHGFVAMKSPAFSTALGLLGFIAPWLAFASESVNREITAAPREMFAIKVIGVGALIGLGIVSLMRKRPSA